MRGVAWAGTALGLVPLLTLAALHATGRTRAGSWWWMASGFGVATVADVWGAFGHAALASQVYPITQAALLMFPLLSRDAMDRYVALLIAAGAISVLARDAEGVDVLLRLVAWGSVSALAYVLMPKGRLRSVLAYGFGALTVAWLAYAMAPGWTSWGALQLARVAVTVAWCGVALNERRRA